MSRPLDALVERRRSLIHLVEKIIQLRRWHDPDVIVELLVAEEKAVHRLKNGTYELRLAGIRGSATAGGDALLRSWLRGAGRTLAPNE